MGMFEETRIINPTYVGMNRRTKNEQHRHENINPTYVGMNRKI